MNNSGVCSLIRLTPVRISATDFRHTSGCAAEKPTSESGSLRELRGNEAFARIGTRKRNPPWLLEKCWKTSAQEALTTWPTSALGQHLISSHSVVQPAEKEEAARAEMCVKRLRKTSSEALIGAEVSERALQRERTDIDVEQRFLETFG